MIVNFIFLHSQCAQNWPSEEVGDFRDAKVSFFLRCKELALRVLRLMAIGLGLDSEVFVNEHKHIGSTYNYMHFFIPVSQRLGGLQDLHDVVCFKVLGMEPHYGVSTILRWTAHM